MSETVITVIGNIVAKPELRYTPSGAAVANFTIASTPRVFNKQTNNWEDGETLFLRSSIWRESAENVAASLDRGVRVVAQGKLVQRTFPDPKTQQNRVSYELQVDEIGPSLRFVTVDIKDGSRPAGGGRGGNSGGSSRPGGNEPVANDDPPF